MKTITKMELKPGMILGEDIVFQGKTLYSAGTKFDAVTIEKMNRYSILCVTIMEEIDFATTHYERIRFDENFKAFENAYNFFLMRYKAEIQQFIRTGQKPADKILLGIYEELTNYVSSGAMLLDYLYNRMPNEDELTYTHCLNSALLAGAFADWIEMSPEDKELLILSGFYYDIGKLQLPYEILWKPDKLTDAEFEMVKRHPVIGYALIRNTILNDHVKNAVIMHHERLDGSGYPYRMAGTKIDIFARYIAIIDSYLAMASPRSYRNALTPLQVIGTFEKNLEKYDVELLMPLLKRIADAQIGSHVQLSDDSIWEVFILHPQVLSRPILKNDANEFLDLLEEPGLEIKKIL